MAVVASDVVGVRFNTSSIPQTANVSGQDPQRNLSPAFFLYSRQPWNRRCCLDASATVSRRHPRR